jgi:hypothetical protein
VSDGDESTVEALVRRRLGAVSYLDHEREALVASIDADERVLDVEDASIGFRGPGILAITSTRVLHLRFRWLLRRIAFFEVEHERIYAVTTQPVRSAGRLRVDYDDGARAFFLIRGGIERARELEEQLRSAMEARHPAIGRRFRPASGA